jgi:DNA-binding NarL/FixJ family response regulator
MIDTTQTVSVLLADASEALLGMLTRFLQTQSGVAVVGLASDGREVLTCAAELRPDVVVIDLAVPGMRGLEVIARLRSARAEQRIVALGSLDLPSYRSGALAAGADAFVFKSVIATDLVPALRAAVAPSGTVHGPVDGA